MATQGVQIHGLMRRLGECPEELYLYSGKEKPGLVPLAIVQDLFYYLGGSSLDPKVREELRQMQHARPAETAFVLLGCYLLSDSFFRDRSELLDGTQKLLLQGFGELAGLASARDFVMNTDRREEMTRLCLRYLNLLPDGESSLQAKNRWESLDTVRIVALMQKAADLRRRQEELRKAMERKAAEEAASKWSRE